MQILELLHIYHRKLFTHFLILIHSTVLQNLDDEDGFEKNLL